MTTSLLLVALLVLVITLADYIVERMFRRRHPEFDEKQAARELDRLVLAADKAVAKRPRVRAVSTFQGE